MLAARRVGRSRNGAKRRQARQAAKPPAPAKAYSAEADDYLMFTEDLPTGEVSRGLRKTGKPEVGKGGLVPLFPRVRRERK